MHLEKFRLSNSKWLPLGHYSLSHGRYLVNCARLDQTQNGRLSAIIYFHMPNILQTVLDASPLL